MNEPTLFDQPVLTATEAHARATDPETSHAAAASITVDGLRTSQAAVLKVLAMRPACYDDLIAHYAEHRRMLPDLFPRQSESGIRTRVAELRDRSYVRDSGGRVTLPSGRQAIVWEVTP